MQRSVVVVPITADRASGRALAEQFIATDHPTSWWAFGNLPGAQALASALGLTGDPRLLIMRLDWPRPVTPKRQRCPRASSSITTCRPIRSTGGRQRRRIRPSPEQGALTAADFLASLDEPWHRDEDLLVARDARSGQLVGYHWTKVEGPDGEVYVIGVHPEVGGHGLGRALLETGIILMRNRGASTIDLYVEAANQGSSRCTGRRIRGHPY
jgi:mycothiol synthase